MDPGVRILRPAWQRKQRACRLLRSSEPPWLLGTIRLPHLGWKRRGTAMTDQLGRITIDSEICHGKPTIRGLRYPVEMVLELLSAGMSAADILADYPDLEADDITAVLEYATQLSRTQRIELLSA
jgi:uncharacterized protein (DUF433 family)